MHQALITFYYFSLGRIGLFLGNKTPTQLMNFTAKVELTPEQQGKVCINLFTYLDASS